MSENRELTMDDYLAMLRRRLKVILIPALIAPLGGFLVSYGFPPKYSSTATVLVEGQKVPDNYVMPVITADFAQRVQTLAEKILNEQLGQIIVSDASQVKPGAEGKVVLVKQGEKAKLISSIPSSTQVQPVITSMSASVSASPSAKTKRPSAGSEPLPGFTIQYSDSDPVRAQEICNALAHKFVDENLKERGEVAAGTTDFLKGQVEEAKKKVDEQDKQLAEFKKQHMGRLPTDAENNIRMLTSLNTQLGSDTQTLDRAQQDKAFAETLLAQQIAAWKSSLSSDNPQNLEQQLNQQRALLMQLQARYTDDYPDVIKAKAEIADVQKRLKEINAASKAANVTPDGDNKAADTASSEPREIQQTRLQIHGYQETIQQATLDQKKVQKAIHEYEGYAETSPEVEQQYKLLTRDNDNAQAFYKDLLAKYSSAQLGTNMETKEQGEQMYVAGFGDLSDTPSFPVRPLFAAAGLGVGLGLGALIAIILEFSDKSIRTERDAAAIMDLPLLISVPWLGEDEENDAAAGGNGHRRFWGRGDSAPPKDHEHVEV
jgi:uncharacterized protein involved in exopolysaccharide biosynthesis